ncbi:unnamed protein product, partial [Urochloa humidicola]
PLQTEAPPGLPPRSRLVAMAQQLLLVVLLLTASTCIATLTSASPPLPEAFFAFVMWALASTALAHAAAAPSE